MSFRSTAAVRRTRLATLGAASAAIAAAVCTGVAATPAAAATSATVRLSNPTAGPTVVYDGGEGNANNLRITKENGQIAVTDRVTVVAGEGCRSVSATKALCAPSFAGRSVRTVFVQLKDLGDVASVEGAFTGQVLAGDGADSMFAGQGDAGGSSAITYSGGPGSDIVSYVRSRVGVTVTLDDRANDGATATFGGRDNVRDDVEQVAGSNLADRLTGDERASTFFGFGGNDTIDAGAGVDSVFAGAGNDVITLRDGAADTADGGPGTDRATADRGTDRLREIETVS